MKYIKLITAPMLDVLITRIVVYSLGLLAAWALWVAYPQFAYGFSGNPEDIHDLQKVFDSGKWENWQGEYRGKRYNPPQFPNGRPPVRFILPKEGKLILTIDLQGFPGLSACDTDSGGQDGRLLIRPCASSKTGKLPGQITWWGPYGGTNNAGWRIASALRFAQEKWGDRIDAEAGIHCIGTSMGATGCILQSMILPDPVLRSQITEVNVTLPFTDFITTQYQRDPAVKKAWGKYPDYSASVPLRMEKGELNKIVYKIKGGSNDDLGEVGTNFFEWCDTYVIACYGFWWAGDRPHTVSGEPGVLNPYFTQERGKPLVIFTDSTGDHDGIRGHHNLGLSYRHTSGGLEVTYSRKTNIGGGVPDQPQSIDVTVTLRPGGKLGRFTLESGKPQILKAKPFTLVYTRHPRHKTPAAGVDDLSNWQSIPDIGRINGLTVEADVGIWNGKHKEIYNCTDSAEWCIAHEARVSPDAKRVVFSVSRATLDYGGKPVVYRLHVNGTETELRDFRIGESELWIYEVDTGEKWQLTNGHNDRYAEWLNNDELVFVSDREGFYPPLAHDGPTYPWKSLQVHRGRIVGTGLVDVINLTPHEVMAMNPVPMTNGDITYVAWEGYEDGFKPRYPGKTAANVWWLARITQWGGFGDIALGAHTPTGPTIKTAAHLTDITGGEQTTIIKGLRCQSEVKPGRILITSYYRANPGGCFGIIFSMDAKLDEWAEPLVEGVSILNNFPERTTNDGREGSGRYIPSSLFATTPWGTDQDAFPRMHKKHGAAGRAGYPFPTTKGLYGYTRARGWCYTSAGTRATYEAMGGEPPCRKEAHIAKVWRMTDPFDPAQSEPILADDDWQYIDARQVATYQQLMGQPMPKQQPKPEGETCTLQVVDARSGELTPIPGGKKVQECREQACAETDALETMTHFRVQPVEHWTRVPSREGYAALGAPIDTLINDDGSLSAENVPCGTPFLMQGVVKNAEHPEGEIVAFDQKLHSLYKGETRTCHGCHDGHSERRAVELLKQGTAEERFSKTLAGRQL